MSDHHEVVMRRYVDAAIHEMEGLLDYMELYAVDGIRSDVELLLSSLRELRKQLD